MPIREVDELPPLPCLPIQKMMVKCGRCGRSNEGLSAFQAHDCISDAEVALSLKLQSLFDQQQKRAVALFNGGML